MTLLKTAAVSALLVAGASVGALAQSPEADAAYRRYCAGDYQRLCSAYSPSSPEVEQCFRQRFKELSPYCRDTINRYGASGRRR